MKRDLNRLLKSWVIHFLVIWIGIIIFTLIPYLYNIQVHGNYYFNTNGSPVTAWQYFLGHINDLGIVVLFTLLVEVNYQYLFKSLHLSLFIASSLLTGIISFIPLAILSGRAIGLTVIEPILLMAAYAFIYSLIRDYYYQIQYKKDVRLQKSENELHTLKAQLNPHFLFNSLNYIYGTALRENANSAAEGIDRLSEMLRYTITVVNDDYVPIAKEIAFIENYIALQKARNSNIVIQTDIQIQPEYPFVAIPPLLLLPFIENAFKYGISIDNPSPIIIKINVEKRALKMEVVNRIIEHRAEVKGNNTGIKNSIKRLNLLYPNNYKLSCQDNNINYTASLYLHLNPSL